MGCRGGTEARYVKFRILCSCGNKMGGNQCRIAWDVGEYSPAWTVGGAGETKIGRFSRRCGASSIECMSCGPGSHCYNAVLGLDHFRARNIMRPSFDSLVTRLAGHARMYPRMYRVRVAG